MFRVEVIHPTPFNAYDVSKPTFEKLGGCSIRSNWEEAVNVVTSRRFAGEQLPSTNRHLYANPPTFPEHCLHLPEMLAFA